MKPKPLTQLYHQFLKPKDIPHEKVFQLVAKLYESGFIEILHNEDDPDLEKYIETEKLTSRQHRDELFKIIEGMKHD